MFSNQFLDKIDMFAFLPEGHGRGRKYPDEKASLSSWLIGAGDQQVVPRLKLFTEDHLSLVGVAVSRSTRRFAQQAAEIETLLLHLETQRCEENHANTQIPISLTRDNTNLPHV